MKGKESKISLVECCTKCAQNSSKEIFIAKLKIRNILLDLVLFWKTLSMYKVAYSEPCHISWIFAKIVNG